MPKPSKQSNTGAMTRDALTKELVIGRLGSAAFQQFMGQYLQGLPAYIDDAQRDFGLDIYDRMLKDPTLISATNVIKTMILGDGPRFIGRVAAPSVVKPDPERQKCYDRSKEIRAVANKMFANLQQPLTLMLAEMLDFMSYGHAVAEQTYTVQDGMLMLTSLRVKPRAAYGFVVDEFMTLKGFLAAKMNTVGIMPSISIVDPAQIIPREKFFVLSYFPIAGDPRGTSILRAAYNPWYLKQQTWPQYLKFLAMFGTPSIVAYLPPDGEAEVEVVDTEGNVTTDDDGYPITISAEDAILNKLVAFANGTAIVLPNGASHQLIQSAGDGKAYIDAFDLYDRQMTKAILIAARAVMEAAHGSKADTSSAQDTLGSFATFLQNQVEVCFYRDVLLPWARYNYGDADAEEYCPYLSLSDVDKRNQVDKGNMIANLARSSYLHFSQFPGIDSDLGLPERDYEAEAEERATNGANAQMFPLNFPAEVASEPLPQEPVDVTGE